MAAMPDSLLIPVAKADIGRRLDQLLLVLVVLAIAVAWTAEPGRPLRFIAFALLLGLSWWVPRALNGSRRNTTCNPGSLCATARIQYRQPVALRLHGDGTLFVQWEAEGPWLVARQPRTLWLGPLLHLAIKLAFGDDAKKVVVNSTKSMTGHLLGAAGGIEAVFSALAVHHQVSPPTINLDNPDPECDLDYCANQAREMDIDVALSNSFGFGGTNGTLVLRRFR